LKGFDIWNSDLFEAFSIMKKIVTLTELDISRLGKYGIKNNLITNIQSICQRNKEIQSFFIHFNMFGKVYEQNCLDVHFRFLDFDGSEIFQEDL
jgi:hypothetical protein